MKKGTLIDEIILLKKIPDAERVLFFKVAELLDIFKEQIAAIREKKGDGESKNVREWSVITASAAVDVRTYQIELKREAGGEWYLSSFFPAPPEGWLAGDIVPDKMVRKLGALALEGLNFLTIKTRRRGGRRYTQYFRFFCYSPNSITGSVSDAPTGRGISGNKGKGEKTKKR